MIINNTGNNYAFRSLVFRPGSQKYVNECLTPRDISVLNNAKTMLSRCKKWDLEITSKGFRIASKQTADAILVEESRLQEKPYNSCLRVEAIYDGHSNDLTTGKYCKFYLDNKNFSTALENYDKYREMPLTEKAIEFVKKFETQEVKFYQEAFLSKLGKFLSDIF